MAGIDWDKIERARAKVCAKPGPPAGWFSVMDYAGKINMSRQRAYTILVQLVEAGEIERKMHHGAHVYRLKG